MIRLRQNKTGSVIALKPKLNTQALKWLKFWLISIGMFLISQIIGLNLIIPLLLVSLILYFKIAINAHKIKPQSILNLALLFLIVLCIAYVVILHNWPAFYIPFCALPMLATILFSELILSLLITVAASLSIAAVVGNNFFAGILLLTSGIFSIIFVRRIRKRDEIIRAGFLIGLIQAISFFFIEQLRVTNWGVYLALLLNGIGSSIIVVGVLPVFEYLFKTITNISLLELFDHPLLHQLRLKAPGTSHHSLIVGNLSEAASEAVGANALLARVGAYFHDIGKLAKPEYFSENLELNNTNKHDSLSPSMSKLIIMNHVKEGIDLAHKYKLNQTVMDFIMQHHGNSLVYYFYRRALEGLEDDQEVKEEGFRYPGPKPDTKETAIVLLADSVEAAARALKEPNPGSITEVVHKIINNKFIDGQLDKCDLTLKDLERISEIFVRILSGIYHSRIDYPEESGNSNKEPSA